MNRPPLFANCLVCQVTNIMILCADLEYIELQELDDLFTSLERRRAVAVANAL